MAAHAVTGITQSIHRANGDGGMFWQQLGAALALDCWTADIPLNTWLMLSRLHDGYEENGGAAYQEIARSVLIKALPLMVLKWQMLGEPRSREGWRKENLNTYNRASDVLLQWEDTAEKTIATLSKALPFPVTGVISQHSVQPWVFDEEYIDLDWEEHLKLCDKAHHGHCYEGYEPTYLLGSWKKDPTDVSQYIADWDGEGEYAAIYSGSSGYLQVIWSRYTMACNKCSPCYPFQGDLDTPGDDFLAYDVPPELRVKEDNDD